MSGKSASTGSREEKLEAIRRQNAADARRGRMVVIVTVAIVVVLVGVVGTVIALAVRDRSTQAGVDPAGVVTEEVPVYTGTTEQADYGDETAELYGYPSGEEGDVTLTIVEDFICPACQAFEQAFGTYVEALPDEGVRVVHAPVAFLDRTSLGSEYSTRSAAAAACVADGADLEAERAFADLLFQNQPAEGTTGLDNATLASYAAQAGADSPEVEQCILDEEFRGFVQRATVAAQEAGVQATPWVLVNGRRVVQPSQEAIAQAIVEAGGPDTSTLGAEPAAGEEAEATTDPAAGTEATAQATAEATG